MFTKSQQFYDLLYSWKDYRAEVDKLHSLVQARKRSQGNLWLDVACGTGKHLELLKEWYSVEGIDLDPEMLAVAKERLPSTVFQQGDFCNFDLGRRYDVVSCLFSSIAYARDTNELEEAVRCLARHLLPGGVLVVEGFIAPDKFQPGHVQLLCADEPDMKVTRMASGEAKAGRVQFEFHYLIGRPTGIEYFLESHDLALFKDDEYAAAFKRAGLAVQHDPEGLEGRSLFVGVSPQ